MKTHRFYVDRLPQGVFRDGRVAHQVRKVLRLKSGETIALFDEQGEEAIFVLEGFQGKDGLSLKREKEVKERRELEKEIILCVSLLKKDHFEIVLQKATEIGVSKIVPLITERTVKFGWKKDRIQTILMEAAEQSGRQSIPAFADPMEPVDVFKMHQKIPKYFFDLEARILNPFEIFNTSEVAAVFIGPEGGWSEKERMSAREAGCIFSGFGALTYRAETAAIAAVALFANAANLKNQL